MLYKGINHIGLVVTNKVRAGQFLREVLGLEPHPKIETWYLVGNCAIHLIQFSNAGVDDSDYHRIQHVALQVDDLSEVLHRLLSHSLKPFQMDFEGKQKSLTSIDDDLSYGIGTIFVYDTDGNLFEFIKIGHGIFMNEANPFSDMS